jgi:hypothetical protein
MQRDACCPFAHIEPLRRLPHGCSIDRDGSNTIALTIVQPVEHAFYIAMVEAIVPFLCGKPLDHRFDGNLDAASAVMARGARP